MRRASSPRDGVVVVAVVAAVALLQWPLRLRFISLVDEGAVFQIAQDLREGKRLYADAVHYAFPGIFWLTAAVFSLFGAKVATARALAVAIFAVASGAVYAIGRWSMSRGAALALVVLFVAYRFAAYPHWQMLNYSSLAVALALVATAILGTALGQRRLWPFALAGGVTAAALLTKQDSGGMTSAALGLAVLLPAPAGAPSRGRTVAAFVGGAALVLGAAAVAVLRGGYATEMFRETILAPLYGARHFAYPGVPSPWPLFRQDPALRGELFSYFPPILFDLSYWAAVDRSWVWRVTAIPDVAVKLVFYLPWIVLPIGAVAAARDRARTELERRRDWLLVLLGAGFLAAFNPPRDWVHLLVLYPPTLLLAASLVARATRRRWVLRGAALAGVGAVAFGAVLLAVQLYRQESIPIAAKRGMLYGTREQAEPLQAALADLSNSAPPRTPLLALPYHPLLNFLSIQPSVTRYYVIWPVDLDDSRDAQVIRALDSHPEAFVVYSPTVVPHFPPFREYAPQLYDYLIDHYEVDGAAGAEPGGFAFMRLRRSDAPRGRLLLGAPLAAAGVVREPFDGPAHAASAEERSTLVREARWPFARVLAVDTLTDAAVAVAFPTTPAAGEHFRARCGVNPDLWTGFPAPRVVFTVVVRDGDAERTVSVTTADPLRNPIDRRWQDVDVDLSPWAGRPVELVLRTAGGRGVPGVAARGGWADPRLSSD